MLFHVFALIIPAKDPNREGLVFLVRTYVCVERGRLARLASLGLLGARVHCEVHGDFLHKFRKSPDVHDV